jgi:hypothetical protein
MSEPSLWDILSEAGLPIAAGFLAWGLVKGADALESVIKEERLKEISRLLTDRSLASFDKAGPSIVTFVFDKLFGSDIFSTKFILRSISASVLFWIILGLLRNVDLFSLFDPGWDKR